MNHFYVIHFGRKRRQALLILALLGFIFLLIGNLNFEKLFASKVEEVALTKGNPEEKKIALTFNISWGEEKVFDILQVLEDNEITATFFVSGEWAERHPQILEQIAKKHEIGMLGYRYKNYVEQEIDQVRKDILYAKEVFRKLGYKNIVYIRPPSGHFNKEIIDLAKRHQLEVVHWSVNSNDWENPGIGKIVETVKKASNGDIVLLHASDAAKQTADALKSIIPHFKDANFSFITISELKNEVSVKEEIIK